MGLLAISADDHSCQDFFCLRGHQPLSNHSGRKHWDPLHSGRSCLQPRWGARWIRKGKRPHLSIVSGQACTDRCLQGWLLQSEFDRRQKEQQLRAQALESDRLQFRNKHETDFSPLACHHHNPTQAFGKINSHNAWDRSILALTHRNIGHFKSPY